jgi:glucan phosphoethanolaminetransferase (alkaline phosphatase superfamily)
MADVHGAQPAGPEPGGGQPAYPVETRDGKRTMMLGALALALLVIAYFVLGAFIPRWWSQQIGRAVDGSFTVGTLLGLCLGFTFTVVPLAVLTFALRPHTSWKLRLTWFVIALALAFPNLCTLGVVAGNGSGAHAGQRTMDVLAPAFRGATLIGAIVAVIVYLAVLYLILRQRPRVGAEPEAG